METVSAWGFIQGIAGIVVGMVVSAAVCFLMIKWSSKPKKPRKSKTKAITGGQFTKPQMAFLRGWYEVGCKDIYRYENLVSFGKIIFAEVHDKEILDMFVSGQTLDLELLFRMQRRKRFLTMLRLLIVSVYLWVKRITRKKSPPVATWHQNKFMKFTIDKDIDIPAVVKKMGIPDPRIRANAESDLIKQITTARRRYPLKNFFKRLTITKTEWEICINLGLDRKWQRGAGKKERAYFETVLKAVKARREQNPWEGLEDELEELAQTIIELENRKQEHAGKEASLEKCSTGEEV